VAAPRKETLAATRTIIYALYDGTALPRYVGKTVDVLRCRLVDHKNAAKAAKLPLHRWLLKHANEVRIVEIETAGKNWAKREQYWIKHYRRVGANLLNLTDGGEGLSGLIPSLTHRKNISIALRRGKHFNCETCQKEFWRKPAAIKTGDCRFCSQRCYHTSLKGIHKPLSTIAIKNGIAAAALKKLSRIHCKYGHPLSGENLSFNSKGIRICKQCRKIHTQTYRNKIK